VAAANGDQGLLFEVKLGPDQCHFERSEMFAVSNQQVGNPQRAPIHRSSDDHSISLPAPTAPVLNGRMQTLPQYSDCHKNLKPQ
jgi:hypothetical protein